MRLTQHFLVYFFLSPFYYKSERAFIFDRWRAFYSRAVLNAFSFLPAAPRDYVLESRMKCNREAEPVKKPRRQNLHYCPRDHLGNLGIHRSQSDFKIKKEAEARENGMGEKPTNKVTFHLFGNAPAARLPVVVVVIHTARIAVVLRPRANVRWTRDQERTEKYSTD